MWSEENTHPDSVSHAVVMANALIIVLIDAEKLERV